MKFQTFDALKDVDVSVDQVSDPIDLRFNYGFLAQATFTGAPTGDVLIEGSNYKEGDQAVWETLDTLTISGTDPVHKNRDAIYWPYIRARKVGGGTGTMTVTFTIKGA